MIGSPAAAMTVTCPHCLHRQSRDRLRYRCPAGCAGEKGGIQVFAAEDLSADGRCPHRRLPQVRRLCESCHTGLLREYVDGRPNLIALVGAPGAGKSTFVGVLAHELQGHVGARFQTLAAEYLGEDSRNRYEQALERPLYQRGQPPRPTPSVGAQPDNRHAPLMLLLKWKTPRRRPFRGELNHSTEVVFYDTAGEDITSSPTIDRLDEYLLAAHGVILMIDTETLLARRSGTADPLASLAPVIEQLNQLKRVDQPVAVVLSKIDVATASDDEFGPASPLRRASRHQGHFDETDSRDVDQDIRAWLRERQLDGLDRVLSATFRRYRYFGLSALGHSPRPDRRVDVSRISPYRVEDPLLWLLTQFGSAPTSGAGR